MGDKTKHWGFLSSITVDDPTLYYTTVDNDEIIVFQDANGNAKQVNSLTITAIDSDLLINLFEGNCISVPSGTSKSIDYLRLSEMQIIGNAGIKIQWYALFY